MAHLQETQEDPRLSREALVVAQLADLEVGPLFCLVEEPVGEAVSDGYYLQHKILMRHWRLPREPAEEWNVVNRVVLPRVYREGVLRMGHDGPVAGYVGVNRMFERIRCHFW